MSAPLDPFSVKSAHKHPNKKKMSNKELRKEKGDVPEFQMAAAALREQCRWSNTGSKYRRRIREGSVFVSNFSVLVSLILFLFYFFLFIYLFIFQSSLKLKFMLY